MTHTAWDELKTITAAELADQVDVAAVEIKPPVFRALEILQCPQKLIVKFLDKHQARVSLLQSGKRRLTVEQMEMLCELAEAILLKRWQELNNDATKAEFNRLVEERHLTEDWPELVTIQMEFAEFMTKIQRAAILKIKEPTDAQ